MFCNSCGNEMPDDAVMCVSCGNMIEESELSPKSEAMPKADAKKFCKFCGKELSVDTVVCFGCGRQVGTINKNIVTSKKNSCSVVSEEKKSYLWLFPFFALIFAFVTLLIAIFGRVGISVDVSHFGALEYAGFGAVVNVFPKVFVILVSVFSPLSILLSTAGYLASFLKEGRQNAKNYFLTLCLCFLTIACPIVMGIFMLPS